MKIKKKEVQGSALRSRSHVNRLFPAINRGAWFNCNPSLGKPLLLHPLPHHSTTIIHHIYPSPSLECVVVSGSKIDHKRFFSNKGHGWLISYITWSRQVIYVSLLISNLWSTF
ncbi:hypothetical protein HanIR_Chr13g0644101 [Helianthus annuus]|nr:hypothetical protein HanIR_Chr13g0644101 [Helianthus annuus]